MLVALRAKKERLNLQYEAIKEKMEKLADALIQKEQEASNVDVEIANLQKLITKEPPKKRMKMEVIPEVSDDDDDGDDPGIPSNLSADSGIKDISMENLSLIDIGDDDVDDESPKK